MAHQRSPNCPKISFLEASEKGKTLYAKEHTHPADREVVAQSLGYSGLNGASLSTIGALRQYGIVEGSGNALRVSDDAVTYFELEGGAERDEALARMLFNPPFFAQIHSEFGESLPSESNLKHYLIKHGFLPKAAEEVINVYRENIRLFEGKYKREDGVTVEREGFKSTGDDAISSAPTSIIAPTPVGSPIWSHSYSFGLSKSATAELHIKGHLTQEALTRLKTYVELTIQALAEDTEQISEVGTEQSMSVG